MAKFLWVRAKEDTLVDHRTKTEEEDWSDLSTKGKSTEGGSRDKRPRRNRDTAWAGRGGARKAKTQLELALVRDVKYKKDFL